VASIDQADDFAADVLVASGGIRHDALRRRDDGDAEAAVRPRQRLDARIDAPAGRGHALDLADRRLALVVAQVDDRLAHALPDLLVGEAADVALFLEHAEHGGVQLGGGHRDLGLARLLAVTDARDHVGERVAHRHRLVSYQLALVTPGIWPLLASSRSIRRESPNLR